MLRRVSGLSGYELQAADGRFGSVIDLLFDDVTWKARWIVIDTGGWLSGRQLLIHPAAIGQADDAQRLLPVSLTKAKIQASRGADEDQPVSRQMRSNPQGYYGWDSTWVEPIAFDGTTFSVWGAPPSYGASSFTSGGNNGWMQERDRHLRSASAVTGYHIHATDGEIGHVESFLVDDEGWDIRYLVVDTRNWLKGDHVLVASAVVTRIDFDNGTVDLRVTREQVRASHAWQANAASPKGERGNLYPGYKSGD